MSKSDLIQQLAETTDFTKAAVTSVLEALGAHVQQSLQADGEVTLPGIGKLKVSHKAERTGRNPKSGETITIPARRVAKFSPAKVLKEALV